MGTTASITYSAKVTISMMTLSTGLSGQHHQGRTSLWVLLLALHISPKL
jgi:hypothetical protein